MTLTVYNAGKLNFVAVISFAVMAMLDNTCTRDMDICKSLAFLRISWHLCERQIVAVVTLFLRNIITFVPKIKREEPIRYHQIREASARIWHTTLRDISNVRPQGLERIKDKHRALKAWKEYGQVFGLKENANVRLFKGPSTPSKHALYWKIPRQCFYKACACAAIDHSLHDMRVCKGCYRVLYCNARCQAR